MSIQTTPQSHADRKTCIDATAAYLARPGANPVYAAAVATVLVAPRDAYVAGYVAFRTAQGVSKSTRLAEVQADGAFDSAWRRWFKTVVDANGVVLTAELAAQLGNRNPGAVPSLSTTDEVFTVDSFLTLVATLPHLQGDTARLAEVSAAKDALATAIAASAAADATEASTGAALRKATRAFDVAWSRAVRSAKAILTEEELALAVPTFIRRNRAEPGAVEGEVKPEPTEVPTGEPAEVPVAVTVDVPVGQPDDTANAIGEIDESEDDLV